MASKNASIVDEWLSDDGLMLIEAWARDGYTESDIAECIGVHTSTLSMWKNKYPEIAAALKNGKEIIDYKVENALLKSALGFTTKEIKVTIGRQVKNGVTVDLVKETTHKEITPNVTAIAMWLNNRKPDTWKRNRDKIEIEDEDTSLQITVLRGPKEEDAEEGVNQSISISKKKKSDVQEGKVDTIKEDDKDYWPEDWEDDE